MNSSTPQHTFTVGTTTTSNSSTLLILPNPIYNNQQYPDSPHHHHMPAVDDQNQSSFISSCGHRNSMLSAAALEFARTASTTSMETSPNPTLFLSSTPVLNDDNCINWASPATTGILPILEHQSEEHHEMSQAQHQAEEQQHMYEGQVYKVINHEQDDQLMMKSGHEHEYDEAAGNTLIDGSSNFDYEFVDCGLMAPPVYTTCSFINSMDDQLLGWEC